MTPSNAALAAQTESAPSLFARFQPWLITFTAALFFFYIFIQLNMFNALSSHLIASFHLSAIQLGHLSAEYFYADVLFLFPAGMILDRFSTRWLLTINMSIATAMTVLFAWSHQLWELEFSRFMIGLVGAFCLLSCVRLASRWFPPRRMALVVGLIVTFAMLGGMLAQTPFAMLIAELGWRQAMLVDAGLGVLILVLIIALVRDFPSSPHLTAASPSHSHSVQFKQLIKLTLLNKQNWLAGFYASLLNLPILLFGALWGSLYLMQIHGLTPNQSTNVTMMLFLGVIIGSPLAGWISDRLALRKQPMIIGAAISLVVTLLIIFMPGLSELMLLLLFFLLGMTTSTQIIAYPLIAESNSPTITASAEGMASTIIMGGGFTQMLFAKLLTLWWVPHYAHHVPIYKLHDYWLALSIMPVAMVVGFVAALFMRETSCVNQ